MSAIGSTPAYPVYNRAPTGASASAAQQPAVQQSYQIDQTTIAGTDDNSGSAAVSLGADLDGTASTTETGWLTLGIAKALQAATAVDPATGHRELIAGAGDQLTQAVTNLLTEAGFTDDEAAAATADLSQDLAQGGRTALAFTGTHGTTYNGTSTFSYAGRSSVDAATNVGQVTHALAIGVDLDTGALNVSLKIHGGYVDQANTLYVNGGFTTENYDQPGQLAWETGRGQGTFTTNGIAGSPLSETETDSSALDVEGTRQIVDSLDGTRSVLNIGYSLVNGRYSEERSTVGLDQSLFATAPVQQLVAEAPVPTASDQIAQTDTPGAGASKSDATGDDALKRLISNLTDPRIFKQNEAASLVAQLAAIADGVRAQTKATAEALDKEIAARKAAAKATPPTAAEQRALADLEAHARDAAAIYDTLGDGDGDGDGDGRRSRQAQVRIGVHQTVAVTQAAPDGDATTLYKRPDGSLGKFTSGPTRVTA